eukprot:1192926-Prorocentrum_minimum.AAC.2
MICFLLWHLIATPVRYGMLCRGGGCCSQRSATRCVSPGTVTTARLGATASPGALRPAYKPKRGKGLWGVECILAVIGTEGPVK